jgi:cyclophilin family peptidyl-prolyl cis-trans isomerase/HEAT repeat protein
LRWIIELEDARTVRGVAAGQDLVVLLADPAARVRRNAALALGRARLAEGVEPLAALLATEPDPEVQQIAAFALGLIGADTAAGALATALSAPDPVVQGRAAEALGLIGHRASAPAIGEMMRAHIAAGALDGVAADDMGSPKSGPTDAVRLGAYALVRLSAYDVLASALLDGNGAVKSRWWPVAYAFQRIGDAKAAPVLLQLLNGEGPTTRAFAARGLGVLKHAPAVAALVTVAGNAADPLPVRTQAVRALGLIGDPAAAPALRAIIVQPKVDPNLQLEAVTALGALKLRSSTDLFVDLASAPWPPVRAAALGGLARADGDTFISAISALDADAHWSVRASLAATLGELGRDRGDARLLDMLRDADQRVIPAVLTALARTALPNAGRVLEDRLRSDDAVVRTAAANGLAQLKAASAVPALAAAVALADKDSTYLARAAALAAIAALDPAAARAPLSAALADKDWAVRLRAAELMRGIDASADVSTIRPAPPRYSTEPPLAALAQLPPYSPVAYVETDKGVIQIELAVADAPRTVANFVALARRGFFNGLTWHRVVPDFVVQAGDPRGDGEGGPGYTIRDEVNERPYLRGTVGMALDWADTGGSQFFITHSPQPHLDARYTVFGHVVAGMDVVDRIAQWDAIRSVRVWDGVNWIGQ